MNRRSLAALVALAAAGLTACGASAPPAKELAIEVIDSLDLPDDVKECMREKVDEFEGDDLDAIAERVDDTNDPDARAELEAFEEALADCNRAA